MANEAQPLRNDKAGLRGTGDVSGVGNDIAFEQRSAFMTRPSRDPVDPNEIGDFPGLESSEGTRHGVHSHYPFLDIRPATDAEKASISLVGTLSDHKTDLR